MKLKGVVFNLVSYASEQATEDPLVPCTPEFKQNMFSKKRDDVSIFKGLIMEYGYGLLL